MEVDIFQIELSERFMFLCDSNDNTKGGNICDGKAM